MRILGISGSLRRDSHNLALLRAAAMMLPPRAEFELFEDLADVPAFNEDNEGVGRLHVSVGVLRDALGRADAVLVATPEYNGSIPGQLKNALDWASRPYASNPLRSKPVTVIGASTGLFGAIWAQAETRKVLATIGARVLDDELPVGQADEAFGPNGALLDTELQAALSVAIAALVREAGPSAGFDAQL